MPHKLRLEWLRVVLIKMEVLRALNFMNIFSNILPGLLLISYIFFIPSWDGLPNLGSFFKNITSWSVGKAQKSLIKSINQIMTKCNPIWVPTFNSMSPKVEPRYSFMVQPFMCRQWYIVLSENDWLSLIILVINYQDEWR